MQHKATNAAPKTTKLEPHIQIPSTIAGSKSCGSETVELSPSRLPGTRFPLTVKLKDALARSSRTPIRSPGTNPGVASQSPTNSLPLHKKPFEW
jgi:hypothetical protein